MLQMFGRDPMLSSDPGQTDVIPALRGCASSRRADVVGSCWPRDIPLTRTGHPRLWFWAPPVMTEPSELLVQRPARRIGLQRADQRQPKEAGQRRRGRGQRGRSRDGET